MIAETISVLRPPFVSLMQKRSALRAKYACAFPPLGTRERYVLPLVQRFQMSRDVAAQVMLQDYALAFGIAGRWSRRKGSWSLDQGRFYASPGLSTKHRKDLRAVALQSLAGGLEADGALRVSVELEASKESAFVLVEAPRQAL